jgi:hypothetical protein
MHETLDVQLPASWLATRLGADRDEIEHLRRGGELFATRPDGADEWLYSAWQFGPGGIVPSSVRQTVRAARAKGLTESRVLAILRRRVGLTGGERMLDLLFQTDGRTVVAAVQAAS